MPVKSSLQSACPVVHAQQFLFSYGKKHKTNLDPDVIRAETGRSFFTTYSFQGDRYACHNSRGLYALSSQAYRCPELAHGESGPGTRKPLAVKPRGFFLPMAG
jgi:hypothetical protein